MMYMEELERIKKEKLNPKEELKQLTSLLNKTNMGSQANEVIQSHIDKVKFRLAQIETLNLLGPIDYYITVNGSRGVKKRQFHKALKQLLRRVNKKLFRLAAKSSNTSLKRFKNDYRVPFIQGYLCIENKTKAGCRCHMHAHVALKLLTDQFSLNNVADAFIECSKGLIFRETKQTPSQNITTTSTTLEIEKPAFPSIHATETEDCEALDGLSKYNSKCLEFLHDDEPEHGIGIYSVQGRQIEKLF